jgi:AcrR family transcriptional regulator
MEKAPDKGKRKKGIETKNRILEAAAELFAYRGFDSVSVYEISSAVGIKESSIYNHFKSKADILEALYESFIQRTHELRPPETEIDKMLMFMQPEEVFKAVLYNFGSSAGGMLENTAMIINIEKFKSARAADIYFKYVIKEPSEYYERLINKMAAAGMIKPVDARLVAEQYNYITVALTKEYYMAKSGLADMRSVIQYMLKTVSFFCGLMKA